MLRSLPRRLTFRRADSRGGPWHGDMPVSIGPGVHVHPGAARVGRVGVPNRLPVDDVEGSPREVGTVGLWIRTSAAHGRSCGNAELRPV